MRLFAVYFADQVRAEVVDITLSNTYEGMLGGRRSGGTGSLLEDLKERQEQIRTGNLKGLYCFDAELVDDVWNELDFTTKPFRNTGSCWNGISHRRNSAVSRWDIWSETWQRNCGLKTSKNTVSSMTCSSEGG